MRDSPPGEGLPCPAGPKTTITLRISMSGTKPFPVYNTLAPHDLSIATKAFKAALELLDESTCPYAPHAARQVIARYIIERALVGERDEGRLTQGVLSCLGVLAKTQPD